MIGLKIREINKNILMLFVICYEYSLSFNNVLKLFAVSEKYFWTFMEICSPMIKMGVRKALSLRKSVDKMLPCLNHRALKYDTLSPREDKILEAFTLFLEDSFSDGEGCLHISQFKDVPYARAYTPKGVLVASNFDIMEKNIDRIGYIQMGENKFYKTSRLMYYMEKYSGDTDLKELENLSVRDILDKISEGVEKINEKEKQECGKLKSK